ncbi:MAG TPA: thrombospondin type 3 repeat-containing protein, partial [Clostridia bacterium]|nr:thrombospondin type 3 repeat-containing protein [Clostridia bacterium]
ILFELSPGSAAGLLPAISAGATAPDEPDTDNDLLPDSWELHWFGNLLAATAESDSDADGFTARAEYIAGTDPVNAVLGLSLHARRNLVNLELSFVSRGTDAIGYQHAARHYQIETAVSARPQTVWSPVPGFSDLLAPPGAETMTCVVPLESGVTRFYRLRVWLQQAP